MKRNTLIKVMATAAVFATASGAVLAAPADTPSSATTEIHWMGKVPTISADAGLVLTGLNGTPLTDALRGGDLYVKSDGTFTSSSINLEMHFLTCEDSSGAITTDGSTDCEAGGGTLGDPTTAEGIGDLIPGSQWTLLNARSNIGGMEDVELAASTEVQMEGSAMVVGTAIPSTTGGRQTFTTVNATALTEAPAVGTQFAVYASILADNGV